MVLPLAPAVTVTGRFSPVLKILLRYATLAIFTRMTVALSRGGWFGAGPAHFDYRFLQHRPAQTELQMRPERVHNDYLNTLADWGLIGAVLVLLCWVAFYYQVFSGWKYVQRSQNDLAAKRSNKAA